ncbi:hypothetical protein YS110_06345 [Acidovorax sp. YS12]|nr:hypothetical protein YS110_06345 [Acidovorax sp. YS12]
MLAQDAAQNVRNLDGWLVLRIGKAVRNGFTVAMDPPPPQACADLGFFVEHMHRVREGGQLMEEHGVEAVQQHVRLIVDQEVERGVARGILQQVAQRHGREVSEQVGGGCYSSRRSTACSACGCSA